ncbi:hypothetical protein ACH5RR_022296 [Cinchona calisaya]|uniref:MADS-box domain-containing protein n=1 Tax=Cinchona calisaya TaxID=153742 RepID=A0ABD2Z934_9GENT
MARKPSMGRQKIKIAKIEVKNHLQVTFSKRRSGLYKKAHELGTLCGVDLAILVFSPAGKVFSFGNPNVDYIIDKFMTRTRNPQPNYNSSAALHLVEAQRNANCIRVLNLQLTRILDELEVEKKRGEAFDLIRKANQNNYWWESPINELGLHELEQLKDSMEDLKKIVTNQASKVMADQVTNSSSSVFALNNGAAAAGGLFDHYENKPAGVTVASVNPNVFNFGYSNGGF